MSTYNGEKYIARQLESIIKQDYQGDICILIRDDGSSDRTIELINDFKLNCQLIANRNIEVRVGKNVGPARSFMRLINKVKQYDYYFLSDQDDVWDQDKVSKAVAMMAESEMPVVYSSAYRVIDGAGNISTIKSEHSQGWMAPLRTLFYNETPGCTMAFDNEMSNIIKSFNFDKCMMHDSLIMFVAILKGLIIYDDIPRMSYRIHNANALGLSSKKIRPMEWVVDKFVTLFKGESYDISEQAKVIFESGIYDEYEDDVELLCDYKKKIMSKINLLYHRDMRCDKSIRWKLSVWCHILFDLY